MNTKIRQTEGAKAFVEQSDITSWENEKRGNYRSVWKVVVSGTRCRPVNGSLKYRVVLKGLLIKLKYSTWRVYFGSQNNEKDYMG